MENIKVFVLTETNVQPSGRPESKTVGVTTDLVEAELHMEQIPARNASGLGYTEYGFQSFSLATELFQAGAETTIFLEGMREFKKQARPIQQFINGMEANEGA